MTKHQHEYPHNHHHHSYDNGSEPRLIFSILLNLTISIAEIIGGILSGSVSLLSDALHNISDTFSLLASLIGIKLSKKNKSEHMTFGYKRAEVLVALLNASLLLVTAVYLFKEAIDRLFHSVPINSTLMIGIASIGLIANILSAILLKKDAKHSLNIRSAYTHLIMDTLSSVSVVIGAILIMVFKIYWIDGIFSIMISIYVLIGGYRILWESIGILMHNVPKSINLKQIETDILRIKGIENIHQVHAWRLTDTDIYLDAHINVAKNLAMADINQILCSVEHLLKKNYGISNTTIQVEHELCKNPKLI